MSFDRALVERLRASDLIGPGEVQAVPLNGGVASDIWRVFAGGREVVVKQALEKLRVAADWRVPVSRNACEVAWLDAANAAVPGAAPQVLGHWPDLNAFAMPWLAPDDYPVWKADLLAGRCDDGVAAAVGMQLAAIHAATAGRDFAVNDDDLFHTIRLEPYFEHLKAIHPQAARALDGLIAATLTHKTALVHGDVSPKNILIGPDGPVFLDAECAWYGDPAFDLAFVLNHLLLKSRLGLDTLPAFAALAAAYRTGVTWEDPDGVDARASRLLPGLLLARIDGKSPVEYLTDDNLKNTVRAFAMRGLIDPPESLAQLARDWRVDMKVPA